MIIQAIVWDWMMAVANVIIINVATGQVEGKEDNRERMEKHIKDLFFFDYRSDKQDSFLG